MRSGLHYKKFKPKINNVLLIIIALILVPIKPFCDSAGRIEWVSPYKEID
jgi:hypothetical protein